MRAYAVNDLNSGTLGAVSGVKTVKPGKAPAAPTVAAPEAIDGGFDVSWSAVTGAAAGGYDILRYLVVYRREATPEIAFPVIPATNNCAGISSSAAAGCVQVNSGTTTTVTGLTNGERYDIQVYALSALNISTLGEASIARFVTPAGAPLAPTFSLQPRNEAVFMTLISANNNGAAITEYLLMYRKKTLGVDWDPTTASIERTHSYGHELIAAADLPLNTSKKFLVNDEGAGVLQNNTTYEVGLRARNDTGLDAVG